MAPTLTRDGLYDCRNTYAAIMLIARVKMLSLDNLIYGRGNYSALLTGAFKLLYKGSQGLIAHISLISEDVACIVKAD